MVADTVTRKFGGLTAVDVAHVEIQRGVITALIGPNGAGKTTFFNLLTGFDKPDTGTWSFNKTSLNNVPAFKVARLGMVRTFQLTKVLSKLTVMENMRVGATGQKGERLLSAMFKPLWKGQEDANTDRAVALLERFLLIKKSEDFAGSLSGGQRKLLEMARALMADPELVMLDEPMAGVNPALKQSLLGHVKSLRDEGRTVLFVEHDMDMVRDISDWVIVMAQGQIVAEGPPDSVMGDQRVIDAYLGAHHDTELQLRGGGEDPRRGGGRDQPQGGRAVSDQTQPAETQPDLSLSSASGDEVPGRAQHLAAADGAVLRADDLIAGYLPGVNILNGADLYCQEGELVGIIGPNGAGKSTLLKALFGLVKIGTGSVSLKGEDVTNQRADTLVSKGIGFVPQTNNVFPSLTIQENLEMGVYQRPSSFKKRFDFVGELFPALIDRKSQRAGSLSGGERQMVAMGRALMMEPSVLLLDEPSAGLSPVMQDEVFVQTRRINRAGVSVVMVEQNARRCLQICDRGYVLDQGRNAYTGSGAQLSKDPKVIELYLGTLAKA